MAAAVIDHRGQKAELNAETLSAWLQPAVLHQSVALLRLRCACAKA